VNLKFTTHSPVNLGGEAMPIVCKFKPDVRLIIIKHIGTISDEEFLHSYKTFIGDTRFDKSFNLLVDLQQANSAIRSSSVLNKLANFVRKQYTDAASYPKIAVIVQSNLSFGLARMFESFSYNVPFDFKIFRTRNAALDWLGLSADLLEGIEQESQQEDSPDSE
jgi:hypothetical protein